MLRLLIEIWPATLPLLLCLLWHGMRMRAARKAGLSPRRWRDAPWFRATLCAIAFAALLLVVHAAAAPAVRGAYVPPHMENGRMVEGQVHD